MQFGVSLQCVEFFLPPFIKLKLTEHFTRDLSSKKIAQAKKREESVMHNLIAYLDHCFYVLFCWFVFLD
jgi:hypothetical protein